MHNFLTKLKLIYCPFLLLAIGFFVIYNLLTWLFIYEFAILSLNENLICFWLPVGLPVIGLYIWVWPRIKLLKLIDKKGDFIYALVACLAITIPTIISQTYLLSATGKLTELDQIRDIDKKPLTKYYVLKKHYIDKKHAAIYSRAEVSGRYYEHLTFYLYVACPILDEVPATDTIKQSPITTPKAWLGTEYSKGISNRSNDEEKEKSLQDFRVEVFNRFSEQDYDQFIYLDRIGKNSQQKGYLSAIRSLPQFSDAEPLIFEAKNEPFEARNGSKLGWIFKSFGIGAGVWLLMLIFPSIDTTKLKKLPEHSFKKKLLIFKAFILSIKINRKTPVTIILITLNILVFTVMVFAGLGVLSIDAQDLYEWGADYRPAVMEGQWWRLLTSMFLHGGVMHLLYNMYGLVMVAVFLEPVLGRGKFLLMYLLCGIAASLASIWWYPATVSVGASGAIFGLYGVLIALLTTNKLNINFKRELMIGTALFIGLTLLVGFTGGIDNAAHIGGLLSGVIGGYILFFFLPKPKRSKGHIKNQKALL